MEMLKDKVVCECTIDTIKKLYNTMLDVATELGHKENKVDKAKMVADAATICALQSLDTFTLTEYTKTNIDLVGTVGIFDVYRDFNSKDNFVIVVIKDTAKKIEVKLTK